MPFLKNYAIARTPPASMAKGITTQGETPDLGLARKQHRNYLQTLRGLGISITVLEPEEDLPDSHFVEDTAIIHQQVAILTQPGANARRAEVARIRPALERVLAVQNLTVNEGAWVDGGDIIFMDNHVLIGISNRTNKEGAECLKTILIEIDPQLTIHFVPFTGVLHLKSGLSALGPDLLLGNPKLKLYQPLPVGRIVWLPREEGYAANTLVVNGAALYFEECQKAHDAIRDAGLNPIGIHLSEFRKMDGSFTCLSLLW